MSQRQASLSARITQFLVVGLAAALFLQQAGLNAYLGWTPKPEAVVPHWAYLIAPAFFLWALWAGASVCVRLDQGAAFGPAITQGLWQVGAGLALGAFTAIALAPSIVHLMGNGFREMRGVQFDWSVANMVLGLAGVLLILLAQRGARLQAKMDEII